MACEQSLLERLMVYSRVCEEAMSEVFVSEEKGAFSAFEEKEREK